MTNSTSTPSSSARTNEAMCSACQRASALPLVEIAESRLHAPQLGLPDRLGAVAQRGDDRRSFASRRHRTVTNELFLDEPSGSSGFAMTGGETHVDEAPEVVH